jgi:acetyltransferase-like isoleucine patch superfamily enzyme
MPWLYHSQLTRGTAHLKWMREWQAEVQAALLEQETVIIGEDCFIAEEAQLFAEPNRPIVIGARCSIAANCYLHGPVSLGSDVSVNTGAHLEGGRAGLVIGNGVRIATGAKLFAFDHGIQPDQPIHLQPTTSRGIVVGDDVWLGAQCGVTDGTRIGAHAVVAMGAVVTRDVPEWAIVAGVPARVIGDRRTWSERDIAAKPST